LSRKQVFNGVNVLELCRAVMGPQVGRELAVHGATVIRIDSYKNPDTLNFIPPFKDKIEINRSGMGALFNTNKYGLSLDLSSPGGHEVATRLVKWADIIGESMRVGSVAKLGLDYQSCQKINPDVIYFSANLQGQDGPHANYTGFGSQIAALAGFWEVAGFPDKEPIGTEAYTDYIAPWYLLTTVIAALDYRHRTGKGVHIDLSQLEAGITFLGPAILDFTVNKRIAHRVGNKHPYAAPHGAYPCLGDDRWIAIAVFNDMEWKALCEALNKPSYIQDPKFATVLRRKENEEELDDLISQWTCGLAVEETMTVLQQAGVSAGIVASAQDLFADPQLRHRQHFRILNHAAIGPHSYHSPAYRLSKTPCELRKAAPCLGEDNLYVLRDILGYSEDDISDMLSDGILTTDGDLLGGTTNR